MELLRNYAQQGSEEAFAEVVRKHVNLVYSVAFRQTGMAAQAEEITQAVFVILARKAASLRPKTILEGWLHETTRLTALSFLRGERRRQFREQEAYMQSILQEPTGDSVWKHMEPLLDEALSKLAQKDRDAVMLRFFKEKSVPEVAAALQVTDAAAQRRVLRAVEKLRRFFTRRGVTVPVAIFTTAMAANSIQAAPATLAQSATAMALTKGATASASTLTLIKGGMKLMAWTKMKTAAVVTLAVIAGTTVTTVVIKKSIPHTQMADDSPGEWIWAPGYKIFKKVPPMLLIRPTKLPAHQVPFDMFGSDRYRTRGKTVKELIIAVYSQKDSRAKLIFPNDLPEDKLDCLIVAPKWWDKLGTEINQRYHLTVRYEFHENGSIYEIKKVP